MFIWELGQDEQLAGVAEGVILLEAAASAQLMSHAVGSLVLLIRCYKTWASASVKGKHLQDHCFY